MCLRGVLVAPGPATPFSLSLHCPGEAAAASLVVLPANGKVTATAA